MGVNRNRHKTRLVSEAEIIGWLNGKALGIELFIGNASDFDTSQVEKKDEVHAINLIDPKIRSGVEEVVSANVEETLKTP